MKEKNRKKKALVRESVWLTLDEDDIRKLVEAHIKKSYKDFRITSFSIVCGMGQGEGFFEEVEVELLCEREEVNDRQIPKR